MSWPDAVAFAAVMLALAVMAVGYFWSVIWTDDSPSWPTGRARLGRERVIVTRLRNGKLGIQYFGDAGDGGVHLLTDATHRLRLEAQHTMDKTRKAPADA